MVCRRPGAQTNANTAGQDEMNGGNFRFSRNTKDENKKNHSYDLAKQAVRIEDDPVMQGLLDVKIDRFDDKDEKEEVFFKGF